MIQSFHYADKLSACHNGLFYILPSCNNRFTQVVGKQKAIVTSTTLPSSHRISMQGMAIMKTSSVVLSVDQGI
ncbi:hypothetical protein AFLA_005642 [Aspergillus flavus NRRL3357]|nr:hypothetical protein AFLA_005642 [Aspergillus flavus NRRL3357]